LTAGIIRLAVTVGIIAAIGFFLVKPALDTADHGIDSFNKALDTSGIQSVDFDEIDKQIQNANRQVQIQIRRSFKTSKKNGNPQKLLRCVQAANGNVRRIERCTRRF
jgi:hypothetical protein